MNKGQNRRIQKSIDKSILIGVPILIIIIITAFFALVIGDSIKKKTYNPTPIKLDEITKWGAYDYSYSDSSQNNYPTNTFIPSSTKTKIPIILKSSTPRPTTKPTARPAQILPAIDTNCPDGCTYHKTGCDIKGNVSFSSGEKIYHLPGHDFLF